MVCKQAGKVAKTLYLQASSAHVETSIVRGMELAELSLSYARMGSIKHAQTIYTPLDF
jgi:hypothetical protein